MPSSAMRPELVAWLEIQGINRRFVTMNPRVDAVIAALGVNICRPSEKRSSPVNLQGGAPSEMSAELRRDVFTVLFPAFATLDLDASTLEFLQSGGRTLLLGESRGEYVSRRMSAARRQDEGARQFQVLCDRARSIAGPVLIGVDQELAGIQRLEGLVPDLPAKNELASLSAAEIEHRAKAVAGAARSLGVNLFLAPIVDVVTGPNPWLENRTLGTDPSEVSRISAAFIRGIQSAGVAAAAKHFPGHHICELDPAVDEAVVPGSAGHIYKLASPFRAAIESGVKAVMTGPALIPGLDPKMSASTSPAIVQTLRQEFGFGGLILSDDLDAKGILRGDTLVNRAIQALHAGVDLLLLAGGPHLTQVVDGIIAAIEAGALDRSRVSQAASNVRQLIEELG